MAAGNRIDKEKATKLWERGLLAKEMAKELNCTVKGVTNFMKKHGMASNAGIFDWEPTDFIDHNKRKYSKYDGVAQ